MSLSFGDDAMVIALGVKMKGEEVVLGFVSRRAGTTENERVCSQFLRSLLERGLNVDQGVLCVIEPRLRTVVGYRQLPCLRAALQSSSNRSGKAVV